MKKLTSGATYFVKRVLPVIFGSAGGFMAILILSQAVANSVFMAISIGLVFGLLVAIFAIRLHSDYMGEVFDDGDRLLIRNMGIEESIDLRDIQEVESTIMQPAGVWLHLRRDSAFGRSIKFLPASSLFGFSKLAKSLNIRIKQAEQGGAGDSASRHA